MDRGGLVLVAFLMTSFIWNPMKLLLLKFLWILHEAWLVNKKTDLNYISTPQLKKKHIRSLIPDMFFFFFLFPNWPLWLVPAVINDVRQNLSGITENYICCGPCGGNLCQLIYLWICAFTAVTHAKTVTEMWLWNGRVVSVIEWPLIYWWKRMRCHSKE